MSDLLPAAAAPHPLLDLSPEVADALAAGRPLVALESTIISHGMPWPQNAKTALAVQDAVRAQGAVPATIAVLDGRLKAGLTDEEIARLGQLGPAAVKASRRDLALLVARRATGATTVAATMMIAALAGLRVFATGGIGGVHRGAETSMDISADLLELARTPVLVVCAGIKSILDLGLTREVLETHGVPLLGWQTAELPAFYSRESGHPVDARLDTPAEVAALMHAHWQLGAGLRRAGAAGTGGIVLANPIPAEHALPRSAVDGAIAQALAEAQAQGVHGKDSTPFLLARVAELTGGVSLAANIQLVLNNARLAAQVAVAYGDQGRAAALPPNG